MKTCDEMVNSLLERRAQYVTAQRKKKKLLAGGAASLCVAALVGVAVWQGADAPPPPPVTVGTTTTITPAKTEDTTATTTTADGAHLTTAPSATTAQPKPTTATPSKTQPTASTIPSTTGKTQSTQTVTQTQTTATQTQPTQTTATTSSTATQTKPTQTTGTTQTTTPPVEDDYIVVDPPIGSGEPMPIYTMSVKVPARCSVTDEYVTVELSYGVPLLGMSPDDITATGYVELSLGHKKQKVAVLKVIDIKEMFTPQYDVEIPLDEDGWPTAFIYAHTETIQVPLSICSDRTGYIQFSLQDYTYEDNEFIFGGGGVSVWYTRMGGDIVFRSDIYWG